MAHIIIPLRRFVLFLFAFALGALGPLGTPPTARAQASFDGTWSILIVTESGDCDRAYRYGVTIERGRILYDGGAGVDLTGQVDRNGRVTATLRRGEQSASGSGRLSGSRGTGSWRGRSPTTQCAGYWEAERR